MGAFGVPRATGEDVGDNGGSVTICDADEMKLRLERVIAGAVNEFERATELVVSGIDLRHEMGGETVVFVKAVL